jgi:hypothetical protein
VLDFIREQVVVRVEVGVGVGLDFGVDFVLDEGLQLRSGQLDVDQLL